MPLASVHSIRFALCLAGLWIAVGCATPKSTLPTLLDAKHSVADESAAWVTTYILRLKRVEKQPQQTTIEWVHTIKTQGSVKPVHLWQNCKRCMDVKLVSADQSVVEEQRYTDPLFEEIEYRDEQGDFKWIEITPAEKIISIRTNVRSRVALLQFRFSEDTAGKWITVRL